MTNPNSTTATELTNLIPEIEAAFPDMEVIYLADTDRIIIRRQLAFQGRPVEQVAYLGYAEDWPSFKVELDAQNEHIARQVAKEQGTDE